MALFDIAIDVSDAQPAIDWGKVAAAGIRLAMVKASEGATFKARCVEAHLAGARAAGIRVVPYHFMTDADPGHQAANFEYAAGPAPGVPYALDWEKRLLRDGTDITAGADQVDAVGRLLAAKTGRNPLGYWGIPGSAPGAPTEFMNSWQRWVPRYPLGMLASFDDMPDSHRSPGVCRSYSGNTPRAAGSTASTAMSTARWRCSRRSTSWPGGSPAPRSSPDAKHTARGEDR